MMRSCCNGFVRRARRNPFRVARLALGAFILTLMSVRWLYRDGSESDAMHVHLSYSRKILRRQISQGSLGASDLSNPSIIAPRSSISRNANYSSAAIRFRNDSSSVTQPHVSSSVTQPHVTQSPSPRSLYAPVTVAIMSSHYFGGEYAREVPECTLEGQPLKCTYVDTLDLANQTWADSATATWWHGAGLCHRQYGRWTNRLPGNTFKARDDQLAIFATMESSVYHPCLDQPAFMEQFDIKSTYRLSSDVPLVYYGSVQRVTWETLPPVRFNDKMNSVAFLNSNCNTPSKREIIVAALSRQPGVRVSSLGQCLPGPAQLPKAHGMKLAAFRRFKFCIAMENSITEDYVTEKVYDALAAGCVPIYYGAPNIERFIPTADSIINYRDFMDPVKLGQEVRRLSENETAYAEKLAWRNQPERWSKAFRDLVQLAESDVHPQCKVCQIIAQRRAKMLQ